MFVETLHRGLQSLMKVIFIRPRHVDIRPHVNNNVHAGPPFRLIPVSRFELSKN